MDGETQDDARADESRALARSKALAKARRAKARADAQRARSAARSAQERRRWIRRETELYACVLAGDPGAHGRWIAHWRTYRWSREGR